MLIVDSQVHLNRIGIEAGLAAMNALGVTAAIIDEFEGADEQGKLLPYHLLANGAKRPVVSMAEAAARRHPDRLAYLLRVEADDPDLDMVVRFTRTSPHAKALRTCARLPDEVRDFGQGAYRPVFAAAAAHGFPLFLRVVQPDLLHDYLKEFTAGPLILDHCGSPADSEAFDRVLALAKYPNLHLKWVHGQAFFKAPTYPFPEMDPFLRKAVDAFGAERIMWASDITESIGGYSAAEALFYVRENALLSQSEKEWILGRTAQKLLKWPAG